MRSNVYYEKTQNTSKEWRILNFRKSTPKEDQVKDQYLFHKLHFQQQRSSRLRGPKNK